MNLLLGQHGMKLELQRIQSHTRRIVLVGVSLFGTGSFYAQLGPEMDLPASTPQVKNSFSQMQSQEGER